ncbi:MAG: histidinol dehydrogenase, partial [Candidatus Nanopelagicales bacterium]
MIKTLDFRNKASGESLALPRSASNVDQVINDVKKIVSDVQSAGDAAVLKWNKTFSNIQQSALLVPKEVIDQALVASDPDLIATLKTAIERVRKFHEIQVRAEQKIEVAPEGWVSIDWI